MDRYKSQGFRGEVLRGLRFNKWGGVNPPLFGYGQNMGIRDLLSRVSQMQKNIGGVGEVIGKTVNDNRDVILSLNKDQMLLGRDAEGKEFLPSYLNDDYFRNPESAMRYAEMKYRLEAEHKMRISHPTLYPDKGKDTPNLIVTGLFQDGMFIETDRDSFTIDSNYIESAEIEQKYGRLVFGLSPESKAFFYEHYLKRKLINLLKRRIK